MGEWPALILRSYEVLAGEPLSPDSAGLSGAAAEAWAATTELIILAHDGAADPRFTYANSAAVALFGYPPSDFVGMHSRLSAEPAHQAQRSAALARAVSSLVRGYSGVRIRADGTRFRIADAALWPVLDERGLRIGQAAAFAEWDEVDG